MSKKLIMLMLSTTLIFTGCAKHEAKKEIIISAAASMTVPLDQVVSNFEDAHPEYDVITNYGSSGSLSKQIEEGAPVDIFISASKAKFQPLLDKEIIKDKNSLFLSNSLVLITYKDFDTTKLSDGELNDFTSYKFSIGDPSTVPAGKYASEAMTSLGIYNTDNTNMILAKSVKQVLEYVETQNVDFGIVYKTDTYNNDNIQLLKEYDPNLHGKISYYIGIIDESVNEETSVIYDYILSDESIDIFSKYGFKTDI